MSRSRYLALITYSVFILSYGIIHYYNYKTLDTVRLSIFIGVAALTLLLILVYKKYMEKKLLKVTENVISSEENQILSKILKLTFKKATLRQTSEEICKVLRIHYNIDYCTIYLANERNELNTVATNISHHYISYMEIEANKILHKLKAQDDIEIYDRGYIQTSNQYLQYRTASYRGVRYMFFIPLKTGQNSLGALLIENKREDLTIKLGLNEGDFFEIITKNISIVLQNFIYKDKLAAASMIDGLTQIYNKRHLEIEMERTIDIYGKNSKIFSVAVLDIDHFKKFNDTYGHLHGDKVLKEVSSFIKNSIRNNIDSISRYGGEEFVILFKKVSNDEVFPRLDVIREKLSKLEIRNDKGTVTPVTASFGLSEFPRDGITTKKLIENADKALYHSKKNGRNKVTIYNSLA